MAVLFANNNSLSAITTKPSGFSGGSMNLISTQTASGSSTISFTSGIDSTYDEYVFKFYNIHPSGLNRFQFNGSIDAGSNYNVVKTTTIFVAHHAEGGSDAALIYQSGDDLAQSTAFQDLMAYGNQDADNDHSLNGTLQLFSPSSTTFVKHFIATTQGNIDTNYSVNSFVAGYFNNTNDVDAIRFQMNSGTFDGVIKLYGVS
jgi:hypothetical protein